MYSGGSLQCIVSTGGGILCGSCSQWERHWSDTVSPISGGSISVVNSNQFPNVVLFLSNGIFVQWYDGCAVDQWVPSLLSRAWNLCQVCLCGSIRCPTLQSDVEVAMYPDGSLQCIVQVVFVQSLVL